MKFISNKKATKTILQINETKLMRKYYYNVIINELSVKFIKLSNKISENHYLAFIFAALFNQMLH